MVLWGVSLQSACATLTHYMYHPDQLYARVSVQLNTWRNNPDFFQKICQIVCGALLIKIARDPLPSKLTRFASVFSTTNMQDFYRLLQLPQTFAFPIQLQRMDVTALQNSLLKLMCDHFHAGYKESENGNILIVEDEKIASITHAVLEKQLQVMEEKGDAYRTVDDFKDVLQKRFRALKTVHDDQSDRDFDFETVDLEMLDVSLISISAISRLEGVICFIVNCSCLILYLREWNLIETARWAEAMGRAAIFGWITTQSLEGWARGLTCIAFCLKMSEAARTLWIASLTSQERRKAQWVTVGSLFEIVANGAGFLQANGLRSFHPITINSLEIVAKGIGLFEIITRPKTW